MVGPQSNFVDRILAMLGRVEYRLATTTEQRDAIFRMRYDCYLREGAIDPNETLRYTDQYDNAPNALLLGVFVDGILSSSIRLHVVTPTCSILPDKGTFPDIIEPMIVAGLKIIDSSRFVVGHEASKAHPGLAYLTVRAGWMGGEHFSVDRILTATRSEHNPFYRRIFGFDVMTEARDYATLKKPVCLLSLDYRAKRERVHRSYPFFMSTAAERNAIFDAGVRVPQRDEMKRWEYVADAHHPDIGKLAEPPAVAGKGRVAASAYR
ncbi:MAG: hypothetical protein ACHQAY_07140 [Hyphomicrobiales bacterium]